MSRCVMKTDLKAKKNGGLRTSYKHVTNCLDMRLIWGSCGMNGEREIELREILH